MAPSLGWRGDVGALIQHGLDYFLTRYRRPDGLFRTLVNADGSPRGLDRSAGALLLVRGKFERDDDSSRFQAAELSPLETLRERLAKAVSIHLRAPATSRATLEALWDLLAQHQGDRPIVLEMEVAHASRRLRSACWTRSP